MKSFSQTLDRFLGRKQESKSTKDPKSRLARVEPLEDRALLSASPSPGAETALVAELTVDSDEDAAVNLESLDVAAPLATSSDVDGDYSVVVAENALEATATVNYIDYDASTGSYVQKSVVATVVNGPKDGPWTSGWYVVQGTITMYNADVWCNGDVRVILADGCNLTINAKSGKSGFACASNTSSRLTIYGQSGGTGELHARGGYRASGIGGDDGEGREGQNITINGGKVYASGGDGGAGIGGGYKGCSNYITINGGYVEARGGVGNDGGAGIGGGYYNRGDNITINNGVVYAWGGDRGAGIGGGEKGFAAVIKINGGTVEARGGYRAAGIGGGGSINYLVGAGDVDDVVISGGTVIAYGGNDGGAGIGGGNAPGASARGEASNITISGGSVEAVGGSGGIGIGDGNGKAGRNIRIYRESIILVGSNKQTTKLLPNHGGDLSDDLGTHKYVEVKTSKLNTPANFKATATTDSTITVSWDAAPNASRYLLEYAAAGTQVWKSAYTNDKTFVVKGLNRDSRYELRVKAIGAGYYKDSDYATINASTDKTALTSVSISGTAKVGETLTANVFPSGATATYAWYRSGETKEIGTGATYKVILADVGHTITVKATGTGSYKNTVESVRTLIVPTVVLATPTNFKTTAKTDSTISVSWDAVPNASSYALAYKTTDAQEWIVVAVNATSYSFKNLTRDKEYQFTVKAIGSGPYSDSDYASLIAKTEKTALTSVSISGTAKVGETLTATNLQPNGATATYAWYRSGETKEIGTGATYRVAIADVGHTITVKATGTGSYKNTVESSKTTIVPRVSLATPTNFKQTATTDATISVSWDAVPNASGYKLEYKKSGTSAWKSVDVVGATYTVVGLTRVTNYQLRVKAVGSGSYSDSAYATLSASTTKTMLTSVSISGTAQVGKTLTATSLQPKGATATYAWYRSGDTNPISKNSSYKVTNADVGRSLTVKATGTGVYAGTVESAPTPVISLVKLDAPTNFRTTAKTDASIAVSWNAVKNATGYKLEYKPASGAEWKVLSSTQTSLVVKGLTRNTEYQFRVKALGSGGYSDSDYATFSASTEKTKLTKVTISGTAQVGNTLTATGLLPKGATATYAWYRSGVSKAIATGATYQIAAADLGKTLSVKATGIGDYTGTVESAKTAKIVPIKLAAPTNFQVVAATDASIAVSWDAVKNADGYALEYRIGTQSWKSQTTTETTFVVDGLKRDTEYQFRVKAVGSGVYSDSNYATLKAKTDKTALTSVSITGTAAVGKTLAATGLAPKGATATYAWYRSGEDAPISKKPTYKVTIDDAGHTLTVKAIGTGSYRGTVESKPTAEVPFVKLETPEDFEAIAKTDSTITVSWDKVDHASGYQIEYKALNAKVWNEAGFTVDDKFVVGGLTRNSDYEIRVCAVGLGGYVDSDYATLEETTAKTKLKSVSIKGDVAVGETLTATDLTPEGATATYAWYRSGENEPIGNNESYKITLEDVGCRLTVVATGTGDYTGAVKSAASAVVPRIKLETPKDFQVIGKTDTMVALSWSPVAHASGYAVDYKETGRDVWIEVASINASQETELETWTLVDGLEPDTEYRFRVKALGSGIYIDSDYASLVDRTEETTAPPTSANKDVFAGIFAEIYAQFDDDLIDDLSILR